MDNFLNRLAPRPSDYGGLPGKITREDDAGNVYDETGRRIFNKFDQTEQPDSWLDTAISTATVPAKLATALVGSLNPYGQDGWQVPPIISEPAAAFARSGELTGFGDDGQFYLPNVQNPQVAQDTLTQLMTVYGGNALGAALKPKPVQNALPQSPLFNLAADDVVSLGGSQIRYRPGSDGSVNIRHLSTPEAEAGRGQARQLMEGITRQADADSVPLTLDAQAWEPQTDVNKLRSFYSSLGFRDVDGSGFMRRDPSINSSGGLLSDNRPSLMGSALASQADALPMDQAITGWHGSRHDFDKFSMDKIGTGTGFAWDGYGLNFSDYRPTAEAYRDMTDGAYLYQAELPSGPYLDYELPLNQHPPEVQAAITDLLSAQRDSPDFAAISDPSLPAGNHYGAIAWNDKLDHRKLNEELAKRGVVGRVVDNPDQPGSRNYTLFQEPTIAHKWRGDEQLYSDNRPSLLGSALASGQGEAKGITAYHGSPHDFDRFDISKIGTGEGAQAYGHGLYFAENEGVAKSYRDNLGGGDLYIKGEKQPFVGAGYAQDTVNRQLMRNHGNVEETLNWLNGEIDTLQRRGVDAETLGEFLAARDNLSTAAAENAVKFDQGGKMYQVRINANPEDFLDWDVPLSKQSDAVRNAIAERFKPNDADPKINARLVELLDGTWNGPDLMSALDHIAQNEGRSGANMAGWGSGASSSLREAGIPGIKYLDQMSRDRYEVSFDNENAVFSDLNAANNFLQRMVDQGKQPILKERRGSRNYVVFDDSLIEILKKYGWLAPGAMYGANSLDQQDQQQPY